MAYIGDSEYKLIVFNCDVHRNFNRISLYVALFLIFNIKYLHKETFNKIILKYLCDVQYNINQALHLAFHHVYNF